MGPSSTLKTKRKGPFKMSIINTIKGCPLFYEFFDEEVEHVISNCKVGTYPKSSFIFKAGENANDVYIIIQGKCHVKKGLKIITTISKGDMLGELVLVNQNKASADIEVIEDTEVLILNYNFIYELYQSHPRIFALFFVNLSRILARRLVTSGAELRALHTELANLKKAS